MAELTFDRGSHIYLLDGKQIPSVTQLLGPVQDWSGIDPEVLNRKAQLGTAVHRACELLDKGTLKRGSVDSRIEGYLAGYEKFKADARPIVAMNERQLHHPQLKYAGTLDRVFMIDGWEWLVDLKSCVTHYPSVGCQTSGYNGLLEANRFNNPKRLRAGLKLTPDGKYDLQRYADPLDWVAFLSLLTIHNWKKKNGLN